MWLAEASSYRRSPFFLLLLGYETGFVEGCTYLPLFRFGGSAVRLATQAIYERGARLRSLQKYACFALSTMRSADRGGLVETRWLGSTSRYKPLNPRLVMVFIRVAHLRSATNALAATWTSPRACPAVLRAGRPCPHLRARANRPSDMPVRCRMLRRLWDDARGHKCRRLCVALRSVMI